MENIGYKTYMQPAFLICAAVLAAAAVGMPIAIESLNVYLEKKPLPLRKSLDLLDEQSLVHYKVISSQMKMSEELVKALGTREYAQWVLEDTRADIESHVRMCSLFITYYDMADAVLHVPGECYIGVGYQRLGAPKGVTFRLKRDGGKQKLPGSCVIFSGAASSHWLGDVKFPVLYLFNVNGTYAGGREKTRAVLQTTFGKFSYYSKIEWKFFNSRLGQEVYPTEDEAIQASGRLLSVILPVLQKEHWPQWPVVDDGQ